MLLNEVMGGSPVKAANMQLPFGDKTVFDPRPPERKNDPNYNNYFFNVWKACPTVGERPVAQLFSPANVRAIVHDHCYVKQHPEFQCLADLGVAGIAEDRREKVEKVTRGQATSKFWAQERTKRLQSSNFGRICKLTEKTDPKKYARSLSCIPPTVKSEAIVHGRKYESIALGRFFEDTGKEPKPCGIFVCKEHPFLGGSPDAVVEESDGSLSLLLRSSVHFRQRIRQLMQKLCPTWRRMVLMLL